MPELANQTWRVASALLETEGGKPVASSRSLARSGTSTSEAVRNATWRGAIEALGMHRESREEVVGAGGTVVDISAQLRRRRWWAEHRWEPTLAEITRMINATWPKTAGRPVEPLRSIKTSWKRSKPVSRHAEYIIDRCRSPIYEIRRQLRDLSEPDLNGVMTKLNEDGADDVIDACLWGGVAEAAIAT